MEAQQIITSLEAKRAFHELRAQRLHAVLCRRDPLGDTVRDIEYHDGVRYGLELAISEILGKSGQTQESCPPLPTTIAKCACGKPLDADGEHDGGYGSFCA